ncbi:hypothetical protein PR048_016883 [Dryococelus australis]|uniref:Uncharacterized protein n=1 Tax=Dryococelus australis TaxID=614101 RepID=A0ABQ9H7X5_9NEOP|nr:hypothetical protein PR048_016883 [Dryococelus australis]
MMTEVSVNVGPQNAGAPPPSAPHHHPTLKTDPGQGQATIKVNINYFKTIPGILKLVQLVSTYTLSLPECSYRGCRKLPASVIEAEGGGVPPPLPS